MKQEKIDSALQHFKEHRPKFTRQGDPVKYYMQTHAGFDFDTEDGSVKWTRVDFTYGSTKFVDDGEYRLTYTESDKKGWKIERYQADDSTNVVAFFSMLFKKDRVKSFEDDSPVRLASLKPKLNMYTVAGVSLLATFLLPKVLLVAGIVYCGYKTFKSK